MYTIVIHGGAWNIPNELVQAHLDGVKHACQTGKEMLDSGGLALDVAEQIITILEDTPCFDAGYGSFLTSGGTCELDALIGDDKYGIGSVASARNIRNPIKLARAVRDKTSHVLIVGEGCQKLAQKEGIPYCPDEELLVDRELERYKEIQDGGEFVIKDAFACPSDTVGCVVKDSFGNIAVALSTGGTPNKMPGRVGDTPIWGAGGYAFKGCGAAATGYGEDLIRTLITKSCVDKMPNMNAQSAVEAQIRDLKEQVNGLGGLIAIDGDNNIGIAFNTPRMAWAYCKHNTSIVVGIDPSDLFSQ